MRRRKVDPGADDSLARIDHIVIGSSNLDVGVRWLEERTGVRAEFGGEHPEFGTHNALLGLGSGQYLEVLSPRPGATVIRALARVSELSEPAPAMWAVVSSDLDETAARLASAGYEVLGPLPGRRIRADGSRLQWRLLFVEGSGLSLAPFFIQWDHDSAQPADDLPAACSLESLYLELPAPGGLRRLLATVELGVELREGSVPAMGVGLRCPKGVIRL